MYYIVYTVQRFWVSMRPKVRKKKGFDWMKLIKTEKILNIICAGRYLLSICAYSCLIMNLLMYIYSPGTYTYYEHKRAGHTRSRVCLYILKTIQSRYNIAVALVKCDILNKIIRKVRAYILIRGTSAFWRYSYYLSIIITFIKCVGYVCIYYTYLHILLVWHIIC